MTYMLNTINELQKDISKGSLNFEELSEIRAKLFEVVLSTYPSEVQTIFDSQIKNKLIYQFEFDTEITGLENGIFTGLSSYAKNAKKTQRKEKHVNAAILGLKEFYKNYISNKKISSRRIPKSVLSKPIPP